MKKYTVVIPAAGQGKRMNREIHKPFICIGGCPILAWTLKRFELHALCQAIVIVVHPEDEQKTRDLVKQYRFQKVTNIVHGGEERQDSIYNGLKNIGSAQYVMIHDGARPFVTKQILDALSEALECYKGVIPAVKVKDTIKFVSEEGTVVGTLPRDQLVAVQTPQAFQTDLLLEAYEFAKENSFLGTDDASLIEYFGKEIMCITGDYENIKITTEEDLDIGEKILTKYERGF